MVTGILLLVFALMLLCGVPIPVALTGGAAVAMEAQGDLAGMLVVQRLFVQLNSFSMMAVPLFIFAGELMNITGITKKLVDFAMTVIGHIRGGLAQVCVLASMLMAGVSGSAGADCAAIGSVLMPPMREKYDDDYAVATLAAASTIGPIIPPSILMVIYCSMTNLSIGEMFISGIVPGVCFGLGLMVLCYLIAKKRNYEVGPKCTWKTRGKAFVTALPALCLPIIIIGGILTGICTATEVGAIACLYAYIYGVVNRKINPFDLKQLFKMLFNASVDTTVTMAVIGMASIFGWLLAYDGFPAMISKVLYGLTSNGTMFMIIMFVFYTICGLFLEGTSLMIIMTPFMAPIAASYGIDPIHYGVFTIVVLLIGSTTPPVGTLLYVACNTARVRPQTVFRLNWVYVAVLSFLCFLFAIIPWFTTWLPGLLYG